MTKVDLVREISNEVGISKVTALKVVEDFMEVVKSSLTKNQNVYLSGFGNFVVKQKAQRIGRNIRQNTSVVIPSHKTVAFKPSKKFIGIVKENVK